MVIFGDDVEIVVVIYSVCVRACVRARARVCVCVCVCDILKSRKPFFRLKVLAPVDAYPGKLE